MFHVANTLPGADEWIAARRRWILVALATFGVVTRVALFTELSDTSCLALVRDRDSDMAFFVEWAQAIDQDPLVNRALHPFHSWHQGVATTHFAEHPPTTVPRGEEEEEARALWNQWYGEKRFHQEPLYAYLLALGPTEQVGDFLWVRLLQLVAGVGTLLLLYDITRRLFGDLAALCTTALACLYAPLVYFELFLLRSGLTVFFSVLLVHLLLGIRDKPPGRHWSILGFAIGIATLLRTHFLLFGVLSLAPILVSRWRIERRIGLRCGAWVVFHCRPESRLDPECHGRGTGHQSYQRGGRDLRWHQSLRL